MGKLSTSISESVKFPFCIQRLKGIWNIANRFSKVTFNQKLCIAITCNTSSYVQISPVTEKNLAVKQTSQIRTYKWLPFCSSILTKAIEQKLPAFPPKNDEENNNGQNNNQYNRNNDIQLPCKNEFKKIWM